MAKNLVLNTTVRGKKHTIFIERNLRLEFKTKKELNAFTVKYKAVLKDNIQMLFNLSGQVYSLYTLHYMQMDYKSIHDFKDVHNSFNEQMYRIHHNPINGQNQTPLQFIKIRNCFYYLSECLHVLKSFSEKYKIYSLRYQLDSILKLFCKLEKEYSNDLQGFELFTGYTDRTKVKPLKLVRDETINRTNGSKVS